MNLEKTRLSPFPFPKHLAQFLVSQLHTPIEIIDGVDAKAIHINRKRAIGKYIIKCLETSPRPIQVKNGITLYVATSVYNYTYEKSAKDSRYSDLYLPEQCIKDIVGIFEDFLRSSLISFMNGVDFGNDYKKSQGGKQKAGIFKFMEMYDIDSIHFDRFKKLYYRSKKNNEFILEKTI